jgi:hypothetical protein
MGKCNQHGHRTTSVHLAYMNDRAALHHENVDNQTARFAFEILVGPQLSSRSTCNLWL